MQYSPLQEKLLVELAQTAYPFLSAETLASKVGTDEKTVKEALASMVCVRNPITVKPGYEHFYRLVNRDYTLRERWNKFRMVAGRA